MGRKDICLSVSRSNRYQKVIPLGRIPENRFQFTKVPVPLRAGPVASTTDETNSASAGTVSISSGRAPIIRIDVRPGNVGNEEIIGEPGRSPEVVHRWFPLVLSRGLVERIVHRVIRPPSFGSGQESRLKPLSDPLLEA